MEATFYKIMWAFGIPFLYFLWEEFFFILIQIFAFL